jgi:hypothetical protein
LRPINSFGQNERHYSHAVDDKAHHTFEGIHGVDVSHAKRGEHGKHDDAHATTEVSAIDGHGKLKKSGAGQGCRAGIMLNARAFASEFLAEREQQSGTESQPGKNLHESMRRSLNQEIRAENSADETGDEQGDENPPGHIEFAAISSSAGRCAGPEGDGIRSIGRNRWNTDEEQGGKGNEASTAGDRIQCAADGTGDKQKNGDRDRQEYRFIRNAARWVITLDFLQLLDCPFVMDIPSVQRAFRLDKDNMRFFFRHGQVLDSAGHDKKFAG